MRIIRFLLVSFIVFGLLSVVVAFVARELWLIYGVAQIRTEITQMRSISRTPANYVRECQQKGAQLNPDIIGSIQLRFTSNQDYVVEVVCRDFPLNPILVSTGSLPMFIQKESGQTGIIWGDRPSGVVLSTFNRRRAVIVEESQVIYETPRSTTVLGSGPVTSCSGVGYSCCASETSVGVGDVFSGVTDCPRTCFASCQQIPIVLSFNSDPFFDPSSRTLTVSPSQSVNFAYVVSAVSDSPVISIDYGDGEVESSSELTGSFSHAYACPQASCTYTARLFVDDQGQRSAQLPGSVINIRVQ